MNKINRLAEYCSRSNQCSFMCLTASLEDQIKKFKKQNGAEFPFYQSDEITLKTIVRANPGLILLNHGTIHDKWHNNDIPPPVEMKNQ